MEFLQQLLRSILLVFCRLCIFLPLLDLLMNLGILISSYFVFQTTLFSV